MADMCLVQYAYWEKTGEVLDCDDCATWAKGGLNNG